MWVKSVGENIEQKNIQLVVRERAYHAGEEGRWVRDGKKRKNAH